MAWDNAFCQQMLELALSEEDFEEFNLERSIKQSKVTKEEIQQLSIEEDLSPHAKLIYILKNGQDVQKVYALNNLPETLKDLSSDDSNIVFDLLNEMLCSDNVSKELCIISGNVLSQIVKDGHVNREIIITHFFDNHIMKNLTSKDKDICTSWLEFLLSSMKLLTPNEINKILRFLEENISLSCFSSTRSSCCKIVSHLVEFVDSETVHSYLVPKMKALCQDIELEIRSNMCAELEHMMCHASKDTIGNSILPELMLLFQDEETSVREVSFSTLTNILPNLDQEYLGNGSITRPIINFYKKISKSKQSEDLITAAKYIGKVLHLLKPYFTEEEISLLLDRFQILCSQGMIQASSSFDMEATTVSFTNAMGVTSSVPSHHNDKNDKDAQCRYWCAYNFPAVLISIPIGSFKTILLPQFVLLMKDFHPAVRRAMAFGLHEVCSLLSRDIHFIFNSLKTILMDSDLEVIDAVLSHLPQTLDCFLNDKVPQSYIADLVSTLIDCQKELSKTLRWRTHEKLLRSFSCFHKHIPSEQIYSKLIPILQMVLLENKVLPVKQAAGHALLVLLRYNTCMDERNEICRWLVTDLAQSTCSRSRLLFLDLCSDMTELFSKAFFKEYFYDVVMTMATDSVVNVRLKFCKVLPLLKSRIKLPCDRLLLQTLEQTVRRIMALEKDADVSRTIRNIIIDLDAVKLTMDGTPLNEDDILDREKELDEENIAEKQINGFYRENHGRSMSISERTSDPAVIKRSKKSVVAGKEKKVSSKGSLSNSSISPKKVSSTSKTKEISSSKSGLQASASTGSASKLTAKKSSSHKARKPPK